MGELPRRWMIAGWVSVAVSTVSVPAIVVWVLVMSMACDVPDLNPACRTLWWWLIGLACGVLAGLIACIYGLIRGKFGVMLRVIAIGMALPLGGLAILIVRQMLLPHQPMM